MERYWRWRFIESIFHKCVLAALLWTDLLCIWTWVAADLDKLERGRHGGHMGSWRICGDMVSDAYSSWVLLCWLWRRHGSTHCSLWNVTTILIGRQSASWIATGRVDTQALLHGCWAAQTRSSRSTEAWIWPQHILCMNLAPTNDW